MRLTEADYRYIRLARFATESGVGFADAIRLAKLAERRAKAEAYAISNDDENARFRADAALKRVEKFAVELGFGVSWPGLWPVVTKDGREFHLPG
jgi:hypothetical protein